MRSLNFIGGEPLAISKVRSRMAAIPIASPRSIGSICEGEPPVPLRARTEGGVTGQPKVAVLVLNHNGKRWLGRCFGSLERLTYGNLEAYLVDNGSGDGSAEFVRQRFPWAKVIRFEENLGFAEAYNRAIEAVDAPYVMLLNNDAEVVASECIERLVRKIRSGPGMAAVACKMVQMADRSRIDSVGGMGIPFWRGFVDIGRGEPDRGQYDGPGFEPFAFCGGAALVDRRAFLMAGGFDGSFFLYAEDVDLSWRLRLMGYGIGYEPSAKVAHYFSGSSGSKAVDPGKLYYCHRNLLRMIIKNCGPALGWALRNYLLFSLLMIAGFSAIDPLKALAVLKAILWNLARLRGSCAERASVQAARRRGEGEVLALMYPRLPRHRPPERPSLRRILDLLFEASQMRRLERFTKGPVHPSSRAAEGFPRPVPGRP